MNLSNCYVVQQVRKINIYILTGFCFGVPRCDSANFYFVCLSPRRVRAPLDRSTSLHDKCSFSFSSSASVAQFECVLFSYSAHDRTMRGSISIIVSSVAMTSISTRCVLTRCLARLQRIFLLFQPSACVHDTGFAMPHQRWRVVVLRCFFVLC